jgi:hypothetical protein
VYKYEKSKGIAPLETEEKIKREYRNFYWRLLFILMLPACLLGAIFMMSAIFLSRIGDTATSQIEAVFEDCFVSNSGRTVRISTEPYNHLKPHENHRSIYSWLGDNDHQFKTILTISDSNYSVKDACKHVIFEQDFTLVYNGKDMVIVNNAGLTAQSTACEDDSIGQVSLNNKSSDLSFVFDILCHDETITETVFKLNTDN